jgi:3-phenylpropionate/trans-cinnamate dioxygenase ferredoxin subunit
MNQNEFVKICKLNDLREKEGKRFIINDVEIALFKVGGNIYALSNICPHQHTNNIFDGFIEEGHIICPMHRWEFNLESGRIRSGGKGLDVYQVILEGEDVCVKVYKKKNNW